MLGKTPNGTMLLANKNYVVEMDPANNTLNINNIISVYMFPKGRILGTDIKPLEPSFGDIHTGEQVERYIVEYPPSIAKDVYISSKINFEDKFIRQEITIENTQSSKLDITLRLSQQKNRSYYVFAPFTNNPLMNHMWISPSFNQEKGLGLAVYFDSENPTYSQTGEVSRVDNSGGLLNWRLSVPAGETRTIIVKYILGYVADSTLLRSHAFKIPSTKQHLLDTETDALFSFKNDDALSSMLDGINGKNPGEVFDETKRAMGQIMNSPVEATVLTTNVNFQELVSKQQLNSLEKALLFRKLIEEKGIPAELNIGIKGGSYYAWVKAYPTIEPLVYDPAGGMSASREIYSDPTPIYCNSNIGSCNWAGSIKTDVVCILNLCSSVYLLSAVILILIIALFLLLQYKANALYKVLGKKKTGQDISQIDGSYMVLNENFTPDNPLEDAVLKEIKSTMGSVKLSDYTRKTGFSSFLIAAAIESLMEKKVIKKL